MITVAIPTYNRGAILVETIERLLALDVRADAIVIADQTREHPPEVAARLEQWSSEGAIHWRRLPEPSIPHAMNEALRMSQTDVVLFLDDDIVPSPRLVAEHAARYDDVSITAVVGQILQPGEEPCTWPDPADDLDFHFSHDRGRFVTNVMAGNLSVRRERALAIGGFDENYIGAAYRFETDFALRLVHAGGRIWFEPSASLRHLKLSSGGLRSFGDHRTTLSPMHAVGDYYFALHHIPRFWPYAARRLKNNVLTRYHASHPWTIPGKLIGELRAIALAKRLVRAGRKPAARL